MTPTDMLDLQNLYSGLSHTVIALAQRSPDRIIGDPDKPYLRRWFIVKNPEGQSIYLHHILRDDDARAMHDHPSDNISLVVAGALRDISPDGVRILHAGDTLERKAEQLHRLEVASIGGCWTLFIKGPNRREWGFQCPGGWRHHTKYVDAQNSGLVGPGCHGLEGSPPPDGVKK